MADDFKNDVIGPCHLIQIDWGDGANTKRYITSIGYVEYGGYNWFDGDETQGQIEALGDWSELKGEVPNRDIALTQTPFIQGFIDGGTWNRTKVTIIEGNRDPATNVFSVISTSTWLMSNVVEDRGLYESVVITLTSELLSVTLDQGDMLAYSSSTQSQLLVAGTVDTGFRYVSDSVAGQGGTPASPGIVSGGNVGYNGRYGINDTANLN